MTFCLTDKPKPDKKASRAGFNELIPGKLYQRGQFLTWPAKKKEAVLAQYGITMVVNLWCKIDPDLSPDLLDRIYLNWHTSPSTVPVNATLLIDTVVGAMRGGHTVLIHCEAGRGRSVWLSARVMAEYLTISRAEALEQIGKVMKHDLTPTLLKDLKG
jgi:hypothetical protein